MADEGIEHLEQAPAGEKVWAVVRVASGNFLEMYDFMVFGYYASAIGRAFFPSKDPFASLMLSLMTFGAGFLMRPIGAIVLGAYTDRAGRRKGLLLTLALMSVGILTLSLAPPFRMIGLFAPVIVVFGRLVQGFSAGAELGGVSVYLSEIATKGHKGFYVSWQSASQQVAVMTAAVLGVLLSLYLKPEAVNDWGWRLPLLFGCAIVPLDLPSPPPPEGDGELRRPQDPAAGGRNPAIPGDHWPKVLTGVGLVTMTTVSFYMITAYTPTFGGLLHLKPMETLIVTFCVGVSNLIWLPVMGAASDRVGRRPILLACTVPDAAHRLAGDGVAGGGAVVRTADGGGAVAERPLRQLQRGDDRLPDRDHSRRGARLGLLPRLQPGHRPVRRVHGGDLHLADPRDGEQRRAGAVAVVRGDLRAGGDAGGGAAGGRGLKR